MRGRVRYPGREEKDRLIRDVEAWIERVGRQSNLTNPQGFLRAMLRSGMEASLDEDGRYIRGKYADYIKY